MKISEENKISSLDKLVDEIQESLYYKNLEKKTQVLNKGISQPELKLTTRGIHTEQVADNAALLAEKLGAQKDEILKARIIGLAHDLGHTPIGHAGEAAIHKNVHAENKSFYFKHSHYSEKVFEILFNETINNSNFAHQN